MHSKNKQALGDPEADDVKNETFKGNLDKYVKGSNVTFTCFQKNWIPGYCLGNEFSCSVTVQSYL